VDEFVSALDAVRDGLTRPDAPGVDYTRADARLAEAEIVAPCVARLTASEIHPPDKARPVGRFSGTALKLVPPLGTFLGETMQPHLAEVRELILRALAHGYFATIDSEGANAAAQGVQINVVRDRRAEDIWPYWVGSISTADSLRLLDRRFVEQVRTACYEGLVHGLRGLGLVGWRRKRVPLIGSFYADAGMTLRLYQTDLFELNLEAQLLAIANNNWPFESMPVH
jgi:hypothetical protein